jgi:uncharacterized protein
MPTPEMTLLLIAAGFLGGVANSMAGGASLFTFPAMLAAGLPPITANASNSFAVVFGNITGAWAERRLLPALSTSIIWSMGTALLGGLIGAVLLITTPESLFTSIVPALIGIATLIFAFSKPIQSWLANQVSAEKTGAMRAALLLPACVYGGYFGAGLGVILMAVIRATSPWELRSANAFKNLLGVLTNATAIALFITWGLISWHEAIIMLCACIAGGLAGIKLLKVVSSETVRTIIITAGCLMTAIYAYKYWF